MQRVTLLHVIWLNPGSVILELSHLVSSLVWFWGFFGRKRLGMNLPVSFQPHPMFVQHEKNRC